MNCASIALNLHLVSHFLSLFLSLSLSLSLLLPSLFSLIYILLLLTIPYSPPSLPVYRHDMPQRLPISDIIGGITWGTVSSIRRWCHLGFVAFMWLILVPICICELNVAIYMYMCMHATINLYDVVYLYMCYSVLI